VVEPVNNCWLYCLLRKARRQRSRMALRIPHIFRFRMGTASYRLHLQEAMGISRGLTRKTPKVEKHHQTKNPAGRGRHIENKSTHENEQLVTKCGIIDPITKELKKRKKLRKIE
jgi:hypothetical protein